MKTFFIITVLFMALGFVSVAEAACNTPRTYTVCASGCDATTLQGAITVVTGVCGSNTNFGATQTISVAAGDHANLATNWPLQPTASNRLIVQGTKDVNGLPLTTINCASGGYNGVYLERNNTTIDGFEIFGCTDGILSQNATGQIFSHLKVHDNSSIGIQVQNDSGTSTYSSSEIYANGNGGIAASGTFTGLYIHDHCTSSGTCFGINGGGTVSYSIFERNGNLVPGAGGDFVGGGTFHHNVFTGGRYEYSSAGNLTTMYDNLVVSPAYQGPLSASGGSGVYYHNTVISTSDGVNADHAAGINWEQMTANGGGTGQAYDNFLVQSGSNVHLAGIAASSTPWPTAQITYQDYNTFRLIGSNVLVGRVGFSNECKTIACWFAAVGVDQHSNVTTANFFGSPSLTTLGCGSVVDVQARVNCLMGLYIPTQEAWCGLTDDGETPGAVAMCANGKVLIGATGAM